MGGCFMVAIFFLSIISLEKKCDYVKEVSQHLERQPSIGKIGQSSEHIWKTQETLRSLKTVVPANRLSTKMKQPLKNGSASLYPVPNMNCPWIAVEIIIGGFLVEGIFSVFVWRSDYVKVVYPKFHLERMSRVTKTGHSIEHIWKHKKFSDC